MELRDIALLNLRRRKAKAAFVVAGLAIGISTMVGLVTLVEAMRADINRKLEQYGANILIVPRTESLPLTYGGISLGGVSFDTREIREADLARIRTIRYAGNIAAVGPLLLGAVDVRKHRMLLAGVDFEAVPILKPWWRIRGRVPHARGVLLGAEVARVLGAQVGDRVAIRGRTLEVTGVLEPTGSQDDHLLIAPLRTVQEVLDKPGRITMAEVAALCRDCPIEIMVQQIAGVLPGARVQAIRQVVQGRMQTLAQFRRFAIGVSAAVLAVGSLVVLVTMMAGVRERTAEIGIFRAIGFRRSHVMRIVLLEAGIVSGLAGILGYGAGVGLARALLPVMASGPRVSVPLDPLVAAGALVLALVLGLGASLYPARVAARLDPNEALRAM